MKKNSIMSSFPAIIPLLVALLVVASVVASVSGQASDAEASARTRFRLKFDGFDQYNYDPNNASEPVIRTKAGEVVGVREGNQEADGDSVVYAFRGIPYAADTSGGNRWRPPQDPQSWSEPRSASEWGAVCPQDDESKFNKVADLNGIATPVTFNHLPPSDPALMSEDCLVLNVFSPSLNETAKAPVMVYIHGGNSFAEGSGNAYPYQSIVRKDVVLVTINYRLGFLGYFAHPSLDATNFGLLDQIKALEWVQDNIEKFGGDPAKVTIFGQSSGGTAVMALMVSPLSRGLFQGAISESGVIQQSLNVNMTEGGRLGVAVGEALDIPSGAGQLEKLRSLPAEKLTPTSEGLRDLAEFYLFVDGKSMDASILQKFVNRKYHKVPVIFGTNANEMASIEAMAAADAAMQQQLQSNESIFEDFHYFPKTVDEYERAVRNTFKEKAYRMFSIFPAQTDAEALKAAIQIKTDIVYGLPAFLLTKIVAENGGKSYLYLFNQKPGGLAGEKIGAFHGSELPYVFNSTQAYNEDFVNSIANQELANTMNTYWTNFARWGNPNGDELVDEATESLPKWTGAKTCPKCLYATRASSKSRWNVLGPKVGIEVIPWFKEESYMLSEPCLLNMISGVGTWFDNQENA